MLEENKLVDAFRFFHEGATGWFSYWSVRAGNRPFNKGFTTRLHARLETTLRRRIGRRRGRRRLHSRRVPRLGPLSVGITLAV